MSLAEIQMLWVSGELSTMERLATTSFLRNGHPVRMFSYQVIPNLPQGVVHEDARSILPESAVFANPAPNGRGGLTVFANFFRYHLLQQRGGIWSDCDVICLRPLDFLDSMDYAFATEQVPNNNSEKIQVQVASCFLKAPVAAPVIERVLEIARAQDLATAPWGSTGPRALHQAATELGLTRYLLSPEIICPVAWWQLPVLVGGMHMLPQNAYALHLWNEVWRRNFLDKNADYDPLSLYQRLKAHYLGRNEVAHA